MKPDSYHLGIWIKCGYILTTIDYLQKGTSLSSDLQFKNCSGFGTHYVLCLSIVNQYIPQFDIHSVITTNLKNRIKSLTKRISKSIVLSMHCAMHIQRDIVSWEPEGFIEHLYAVENQKGANAVQSVWH